MKKKSSNWFEGKYVAMKDGGYLDITEAMHDSYDGKFCFQVTAEIFRNCSKAKAFSCLNRTVRNRIGNMAYIAL